MQRDKN